MVGPFLSAVGNLAYDLSDQDVIDYFGKVGPVKTVRQVFTTGIYPVFSCVMFLLRFILAHSNPSPLPCRCRIVTERETGKPRGFGFIEFFDIPTAESAIRNLSGSELNGRTIRIVFAEGGPGDFRPRQGKLPPPPWSFAL